MPQVTTRVRGLAPWQPREATRTLLETIQAVLVEYAEYLPLSVRQIFYRLVGVHGYEKTERAYKRLGEHLNRARRAGMVPFDAIRDDGTTLAEPLMWDNPTELIETFLHHAQNFRLNRQDGQAKPLRFLIEAAGMVPQIERVADPFGITVQSSSGFDSLTEKDDLAKWASQWPSVEILHIGDHDPSGTHAFSSMAEDVQQLAEDHGFDTSFQFTRLAVTPAQIVELGLPTAPPKETDNRSFTGETTQAEAIAPDVLAQIIEDAIRERFDDAAYRRVLDRERRIRRDLTRRLRSLLNGEGG